VVILTALLLTSASLNAQTNQVAGSPPLSQPLVREGDLAFKLVDALKVGAAADEIEAESMLSSVGIMPRNGWIADYPVTPDIIGELNISVSDAVVSGKLAMSKDAALKTFQDVIAEQSLLVKEDTTSQGSAAMSAPNYPESDVMNGYYDNEGPPVVSYYAPPPDYTYLYTWVPYPFWWSDFWFPGFFVLVDFHVRVHGPVYGQPQGHGQFVTNHFRDPGTGKIFRIDPFNRSHGGIFVGRGGGGSSSSSVGNGGQAILNNSNSRASVKTNVTRYRGYGVSGSGYSSGASSTVFEHSVNGPAERAASDRGFESRSSAGHTSSGAGSRGGGGASGGFHGGGRR
jgi:hypothetical protein